MAQDLALDSNHDIYLEDNDFVLVAGPDEAAQSIKIRLWTYYGEWFLNTSLGTPHYEQILGNPFRPNNQAAIYRRRILATQGVINLQDFSFSRVGRDLEVSAVARLEDGSTVPIIIAV